MRFWKKTRRVPPRSYQRETVVYDPLHDLALLEQKTRALDQAAPLVGWQLPACFARLRRLLEARLKHGGRECVQVLHLMETFTLAEVALAIEDALSLGPIGFDAVKHLPQCRIERRPPRLDDDGLWAWRLSQTVKLSIRQ